MPQCTGNHGNHGTCLGVDKALRWACCRGKGGLHSANINGFQTQRLRMNNMEAVECFGSVTFNAIVRTVQVLH